MSREPHRPGRHFLQIPGPTPIPERILSAMSKQIVDHRGPKLQRLAKSIFADLKLLFNTKNDVMLFPSSGTGAWEAALVNTLSPGDKVLVVETGQFAFLWAEMAKNLGLVPEIIETDWRIGADANLIEAALRKDTNHEIKALCIVHNETSTGCRSWLKEIRDAIDAAGHPALFMIDTISSLGVMEIQHDAWGIDVTISGSQKGLMLPPALSFNAVSDKAIEASKSAKLSKSYFRWAEMRAANADGFFPYTPATGLLYGLSEAMAMLKEEGFDNVYARHDRLAEATRRAVEAWGLEIWCRDDKYHSPAVTAVMLPEGHNADQFRGNVLQTFDMSLGVGLKKLSGKAFRIGHLGDTNELTIMGALAGVEMGLQISGIPHSKGGVDAAMAFLAEKLSPRSQKAA